MSKNNKISLNKNTVYNTIKSVFGIIYPLITFPYISRVLMTDNVGKINFGNSVVSYFSLVASLGVTTYAIRECSKVKSDKEGLSKTASEIFSINIISTIISYVALIVTLIVAKPLENYKMLICIQSATILFTTLGADWINTVMEDFRYITIRTVAMQVLSLVLMFVFVQNPDDYIIYVIISLVSTAGANILNIFYRRKFCSIRFTFKPDLRKHLPPILVLFSLLISQIIYTNSDMTILGLVKGDYEVGLYSTSVKIYNLVNTTVASIAWVVMPQLTSSFEKKDYESVNKLLRYSLNFIVILGVPAFCGIEVIADHIIGFFAGDAYVGATMSIRILGVALVLSFIGGWISNIILIPSGREKVCLYSSIVSASINIILNLIFIPRWGLNAAAATTVLSELVGVLIVGWFIDKNVKIINIWKMIRGPIIGGIGILIIGYIFRNIFVESWKISILTIFASALWYLIVLAVSKDEFFMGYAIPILNKLKERINK